MPFLRVMSIWSVYVSGLRIPAQSPKEPADNSTKFMKARKCLFLLGRLKDQQTNLQNL